MAVVGRWMMMVTNRTSVLVLLPKGRHLHPGSRSSRRCPAASRTLSTRRYGEVCILGIVDERFMLVF